MSKTSVMEFVKKYTMILVLILVTAFFAWQTDGKILLPQNINNLIAQNAYVFVLATGMLLCILTGGNIDLSVGSVVCFVGAVGATMMETYEMNMWVSILVMLLVGLVIGAWQGFWIAFVRIPPFITTLSGMLVFRGLSNVVLNGMTVSITNQTFIRIFGGGADCYVPDFFGGNGFNITCMLAGVIACVIYALLTFRGYFARKKKGYETGSFNAMLAKVVVLCAVLLWFTYNLSLHKGNEKATKLSGINTDKVYFIAYTNMGLLAALAGMLTIARMTSAQPTYGQNYEMDAIGSCFIGGASAYGGIGTVPGVIVGAVLMGVINLGMSIMGVDANYQRVVKGLVLLAAVIFDVVSKRKNQ